MQLATQANRLMLYSLLQAIIACDTAHVCLQPCCLHSFAPTASRHGKTACTLLQVMLRLAEGPAFVAAMAAQQDYEASVLQKAHRILTEKSLGEYAHAARLQALIEQVRSQGLSSDGMLGPAMAPSLPVQAARTGSILHIDGVLERAMAALLLQTRWVFQAGSTSYILSAHHFCHRLGQQLTP